VQTAGPIFSLDTPVKTIAANHDGKVVLDRDIPGLLASRSYFLFDDMKSILRLLRGILPVVVRLLPYGRNQDAPCSNASAFAVE